MPVTWGARCEPRAINKIKEHVRQKSVKDASTWEAFSRLSLALQALKLVKARSRARCLCCPGPFKTSNLSNGKISTSISNGKISYFKLPSSQQSHKSLLSATDPSTSRRQTPDLPLVLRMYQQASESLVSGARTVPSVPTVGGGSLDYWADGRVQMRAARRATKYYCGCMGFLRYIVALCAAGAKLVRWCPEMANLSQATDPPDGAGSPGWCRSSALVSAVQLSAKYLMSRAVGDRPWQCLLGSFFFFNDGSPRSESNANVEHDSETMMLATAPPANLICSLFGVPVADSDGSTDPDAVPIWTPVLDS
ncbi:hypothetical protein K438DRAFT_1772448 [Mycena galopus ATCC 62051]|nr:hypothetical protein K438DRAFT_1772448 [Mycena galopus ATCC 62051]